MKTKFLRSAVTVFVSLLLGLSVYAQTGNVSGNVFYHNDPDLPLEDVFVALTDASGNVVGVDTTDINGAYAFYGLSNGVYDLNFSTDIDPAGIAIQDAHLIILHIVGVITFTPIEFLAADVTSDGEITMADFFTIVIGWLVQGNPFPSGEWVFESATVNVGGGNRDGVSTGGSSSGDVDGSWLPTSRDIPFANVNYLASTYSSNSVEIPLNINYDGALGGFLLVLDYPSELINITGVQTKLSDLNYQVYENEVRISWVDINLENIRTEGDPLISLVAEVLDDSKDIRIEVMPESHLIDNKGNPIEEINYVLPILQKQEFKAEFSKLFPNPANNHINFNASLPEEGQIHICFYDLNAKLVKEIKSFEQAGFMNDVINIQDLQNGMYMYRVNFKGKNFEFDTADILLINR
ncbi:MAG: T9SS type A sorting domain-containing protein [Bacteroidota bacterium]|nr:T9SS type A sorting domain-containing protein [Bacteroidota bacterium]